MNIVDAYKADFLAYLNATIKIKEPKNLYEPIQYILQIGGKRLRPILTIMTCDLFNGNVNKAYDAALAIEVFHNFTLIHDDIMDSAPIRRGKETVHIKWDINTGILSGDAMMIMAYKCFENYEDRIFKKLMCLFNQTALEVCEGQQLDVDFELRNDVSISEYIKMITNKTSVLVAAAMKMGAIVAESSEKNADSLYEYGINLGLAFQLQDDYLDTFGNPETFGKQIGGDIIENKKTYLYLKAMELSDAHDRQKLEFFYKQKLEDNSIKIDEVKRIFEQCDIPTLIQKLIHEYTETAFDLLKNMNISELNRQKLKDFGSFLMARDK